MYGWDYTVCGGPAHGRHPFAASEGRGRGLGGTAVRRDRVGEGRVRPELAGRGHGGGAERRGREGPVDYQRGPVRGRLDDSNQDGVRSQGRPPDESATI